MSNLIDLLREVSITEFNSAGTGIFAEILAFPQQDFLDLLSCGDHGALLR